MVPATTVAVATFFALSSVALADVPKDMKPIQVQVTIYFESYCPDSVKFLTKQLYPTYLELGDYMNISLVPYGKANMSRNPATGETMISCHHGEKECVGNKVIACVLMKKDTSFSEQFKFINCTSSKIAANPKMEEYPTKECAAHVGIIGEEVEKCSNSTEGNTFLEHYGNMTISLSSVPTVVFNNNLADSDQKIAVSDFKSALCSKISGVKPTQCPKNGAGYLHATLWPIIATLIISFRA